MSRELLWLTLTIALTALIWVPYILDRIMVRGLMAHAGKSVARNDKTQSPWAIRHDVCPRQCDREPGRSSRRWC